MDLPRAGSRARRWPAAVLQASKGHGRRHRAASRRGRMARRRPAGIGGPGPLTWPGERLEEAIGAGAGGVRGRDGDGGGDRMDKDRRKKKEKGKKRKGEEEKKKRKKRKKRKTLRRAI